VTALAPALRDRVLERLGFAAPPAADLGGLTALYAAWCRRVPFDNVHKLIHLAEGRPGPLPGDAPADFFEAWLADGAGGTCWAGSGALCALLRALGFQASRALATMLVAPDLPPNHGTVCVELAGETWLVDTAMLHGEPLRLVPGRESEVAHPAFGVRARPDGERWRVHWRPLHAPDGLDCRLDALGASEARCAALHEETRGWSPFNFSLYLRVLRGPRVAGAAFGRSVELDPAGGVRAVPYEPRERQRLLVEEFGIGEALAARLPADRPLAPPPGSRTAQRAAR
jgi:N-hydroxyarylamine O-acetyltransferase